MARARRNVAKENLAHSNRPISWLHAIDIRLASGVKKLGDVGIIRLGIIAAGVITFVVFAEEAYDEYFGKGRIDRAWSTLTKNAISVRDRSDAFNFLFTIGEELTGLDISCSRIGKLGDNKDCIQPPIFDSLSLELEPDRNHIGFISKYFVNSYTIKSLDRIDISGVSIEYSAIKHTGFTNSNLSNARIVSSNITGSYFAGTLDGLYIGGVIADSAIFEVEKILVLNNVNITGATFILIGDNAEIYAENLYVDVRHPPLCLVVGKQNNNSDYFSFQNCPSSLRKKITFCEYIDVIYTEPRETLDRSNLPKLDPCAQNVNYKYRSVSLPYAEYIYSESYQYQDGMSRTFKFDRIRSYFFPDSMPILWNRLSSAK